MATTSLGMQHCVSVLLTNYQYSIVAVVLVHCTIKCCTFLHIFLPGSSKLDTALITFMSPSKANFFKDGIRHIHGQNFQSKKCLPHWYCSVYSITYGLWFWEQWSHNCVCVFLYIKSAMNLDGPPTFCLNLPSKWPPDFPISMWKAPSLAM